MNRTAVATIATLLSMGLLDAIWLATMTNRLYRSELAGLLLETPRWLPATLFYLLYALGVVALVVGPALSGEWPLPRVIALGALLGLVAYGTYDLTNQATLRGWSLRLTIVDMTWGASLTGVVSTIAVVVARRIG